MTYGVCMCTCGPPPGGVCRACGMVGPPLPSPQPYQPPRWFPVVPNTPPAPGQVTIIQSPSVEQIRQIVREELDRDAGDKQEDRGDA
jgi:hypothetical protein